MYVCIYVCCWSWEIGLRGSLGYGEACGSGDVDVAVVASLWIVKFLLSLAKSRSAFVLNEGIGFV